jgi:hypothetical protein
MLAQGVTRSVEKMIGSFQRGEDESTAHALLELCKDLQRAITNTASINSNANPLFA